MSDDKMREDLIAQMPESVDRIRNQLYSTVGGKLSHEGLALVWYLIEQEFGQAAQRQGGEAVGELVVFDDEALPQFAASENAYSLSFGRHTLYTAPQPCASQTAESDTQEGLSLGGDAQRVDWKPCNPACEDGIDCMRNSNCGCDNAVNARRGLEKQEEPLEVDTQEKMFKDLILDWEFDWGVDLSGPEREALCLQIVSKTEGQQQAGEPVAWIVRRYEECVGICPDKDEADRLASAMNAEVYPLYTAPQPQPAVPETPTEEMFWHGVTALDRGLKQFPDNYTQVVSNIWEDMLAAAPEPPQPQPDWIACSERLPNESDADPWGNVAMIFFPERENDRPQIVRWEYLAKFDFGRKVSSTCIWTHTGLKRPEPPEDAI